MSDEMIDVGAAKLSKADAAKVLEVMRRAVGRGGRFVARVTNPDAPRSQIKWEQLLQYPAPTSVATIGDYSTWRVAEKPVSFETWSLLCRCGFVKCRESTPVEMIYVVRSTCRVFIAQHECVAVHDVMQKWFDRNVGVSSAWSDAAVVLASESKEHAARRAVIERSAAALKGLRLGCSCNLAIDGESKCPAIALSKLANTLAVPSREYFKRVEEAQLAMKDSTRKEHTKPPTRAEIAKARAASEEKQRQDAVSQ